MFDKKDIASKLQGLDLGSIIAEDDHALNDTFVMSTTYYDFINNRYDIIRGAKGTGKSALLLYAVNNQPLIPELSNTILVKANEHSGDPHFKKAFEEIGENSALSTYTEAWKVYLINLVWPKIKGVNTPSDEIEKLDTYLNSKKVITKDVGFFAKLLYAVLRAKHTITVDDIEYGTQLGEIGQEKDFIDFNYIFAKINEILATNHQRVWILLDRLDDAFPDWSSSSHLAIKSLFYVYKELLGLANLKLKTFIRSDIFDRITADNEGFTSLSHVHARTSAPIHWDDARIEEFICNRFKKLFPESSNTDIIEIVLGKQIDAGKKQPPSMRWVTNHLRDGQDNCTPRDILSLLNNARQYTLIELETKSSKDEYETLFTKNAIKQAWKATSKDKLTTQIYAENPELKATIELFRGKKARFSLEKLEELLGEDYLKKCEQLHYVGILSKTGDNMMVPFLYRPALSTRQGTA